MADQHGVQGLRERIVGVDLTVPLATGGEVVYANLDNAASTPALKAAKRAGDRLLEWYASIHRGAGYKSQLASEWYEESREVVLEYVGADPDYHCVILTTNTTDAINRLARKFPRDNDRCIVISNVEHHANDLPWRERGHIARLPVSDRGEIDPDDLDAVLRREGGRARLVSLTGASNVVGTLQPIHDLARVAHRHGVPIAIDAAQLAPHLPITMTPEGDEEARIDFLFLSGHKMYAPFGGGALIGPKNFFRSTSPAVRGGGAVLVVEPNGVDWAMPPESEEAGSPNVLGAVTLAAAMRELKSIGFDRLEERERSLARRLLAGLKRIDGVTIYGLSEEADLPRRLGVVSFNLRGVPHALVAATLAHEGGIGVRNGCFCAHPFVLQMLGTNPEEAETYRERLRRGDRRDVPGAVRISFGLYNTEEEVDRALEHLGAVARGRTKLRYKQDGKQGEFIPEGIPAPAGLPLDKMLASLNSAPGA